MKVGGARPRRAFGVLLACLALVAVGCGQELPQNTLAPAGEVAETQRNLFYFVGGIAIAVFVLVEGLLVYALVKFRRRSQTSSETTRPELPRQVHGNTRLEVIWTLIPALLLVVVAVPTIATIFALSAEPVAADDPLHVKVLAYQWWWEYEYPDHGVITANELHIPTGRPVTVTLESADVIHSFWPPRLAGKQDVIPGRENRLTFSADVAGVYHGQCAEFCGVSHANMKLRVIAQEPDEFEEWLEAQREPAADPQTELEREGEQLFQDLPCAACHAIRGTDALGRVAPDLTHFASRDTFAGAMFERTDDNLIAWLRDPPGTKPGALMPAVDMTESQIRAVVAYLQSLE